MATPWQPMALRVKDAVHTLQCLRGRTVPDGPEAAEELQSMIDAAEGAVLDALRAVEAACRAERSRLFPGEAAGPGNPEGAD